MLQPISLRTQHTGSKTNQSRACKSSLYLYFLSYCLFFETTCFIPFEGRLNSLKSIGIMMMMMMMILSRDRNLLFSSIKLIASLLMFTSFSLLQGIPTHLTPLLIRSLYFPGNYWRRSFHWQSSLLIKSSSVFTRIKLQQQKRAYLITWRRILRSPTEEELTGFSFFCSLIQDLEGSSFRQVFIKCFFISKMEKMKFPLSSSPCFILLLLLCLSAFIFQVWERKLQVETIRTFKIVFVYAQSSLLGSSLITRERTMCVCIIELCVPWEERLYSQEPERDNKSELKQLQSNERTKSMLPFLSFQSSVILSFEFSSSFSLL